jgi:starch-binding outer membrane protein, SusD/RagB family
MMHTRSALALAALVGAASCTDLKEYPVTGVTSGYFDTPAGAEAATLGSYAGLRGIYGGENEIRLFMVGTDSWEKGEQFDASGAGFFNDYTAQFTSTEGSGSVQGMWQSAYSSINTANTAIASISASTTLLPTLKTTRLAENRFLRALYYFELVRTYGDVQLNLEPTQGVSIQAHRTPKDSIYSAAIIPDLEFAIANLPLKGAQTEYFRATKGAAQTLLSEVYVTRAAPGDFDKAIQLTSDVIASGKYTLNPNFGSLFCLPTTSTGACDYAASQKTDPELIFSVTFTGDNGTDAFGNNLHLYWVMWYDNSAYTNPGLPRSPAYGRPYRRTRPTNHLLTLFNRATDSRLDASFQTVWLRAPGDTAILLTLSPNTETNPSARFGKYGMPQLTNGRFPTLKKWLDQTRTDANVFPGHRDRQLWRLADVYLLRAEAAIRAGRPADAIADLNVIRRRAAIANQNNDVDVAAYNASPIDYLLDERERELAGEERRFFTLTRQGSEVFLRRVKAFNSTASAVQAFHMLRPIPQTQIDRTEGTKTAFPQNPGY